MFSMEGVWESKIITIKRITHRELDTLFQQLESITNTDVTVTGNNRSSTQNLHKSIQSITLSTVTSNEVISSDKYL